MSRMYVFHNFINLFIYYIIDLDIDNHLFVDFYILFIYIFHTFIHLFTYYFIVLIIYIFIHSFVNDSCTYFLNLLVSFVYALNYLFSVSFIYLLLYCFSYIYIYSFIHLLMIDL